MKFFKKFFTKSSDSYCTNTLVDYGSIEISLSQCTPLHNAIQRIHGLTMQTNISLKKREANAYDKDIMLSQESSLTSDEKKLKQMLNIFRYCNCPPYPNTWVDLQKKLFLDLLYKGISGIVLMHINGKLEHIIPVHNLVFGSTANFDNGFTCNVPAYKLGMFTMSETVILNCALNDDGLYSHIDGNNNIEYILFPIMNFDTHDLGLSNTSSCGLLQYGSTNHVKYKPIIDGIKIDCYLNVIVKEITHRFFKQGCRPSGILNIRSEDGEHVSEEEFSNVVKAAQEGLSRAANTGKIIIPNRDKMVVEYKAIQIQNSLQDTSKILETTNRQIYSFFGLTADYVEGQNMKYNNASIYSIQEAKTALRLSKMIVAQLNSYFQSYIKNKIIGIQTQKYELYVDDSNVDEIQEQYFKDMIMLKTNGIITPNEAVKHINKIERFGDLNTSSDGDTLMPPQKMSSLAN